jgi:hypothetical protein
MLSANRHWILFPPWEIQHCREQGLGKGWQNRITFAATCRPLLFKTVKPFGISAVTSPGYGDLTCLPCANPVRAACGEEPGRDAAHKLGPLSLQNGLHDETKCR